MTNTQYNCHLVTTPVSMLVSKRDTISTLVNLHSKKLNKAVFKIDVLTIISAFILMMAGMLLSYLLLRAGLTITGGIFAGGTLISASIAFLNFGRPVARK